LAKVTGVASAIKQWWGKRDFQICSGNLVESFFFLTVQI